MTIAKLTIAVVISAFATSAMAATACTHGNKSGRYANTNPPPKPSSPAAPSTGGVKVQGAIGG